MNKYNVGFTEKGAVISDIDCFDPDLIFDCGQCFRFEKNGNVWSGVTGTRLLSIEALGGGKYLLRGIGKEDFPKIAHFLDLDSDYPTMREDILSSMKAHGVDTAHMEKAMECGKGIRLLRQDGWESLCSFIISQNNNIPRIKKIVSELSEKFGTAFSDGETSCYSFPTAKALSDAGEEAIFACKTGFRAKYIEDAANKVSDGSIDLSKISDETLFTNADADSYLMTIKGVGTKVSACTLLFGFHRLSFFPVDVWVKRVMAKYYEKGTDPAVFGSYAGLAQQYLFYYERFLT